MAKTKCQNPLPDTEAKPMSELFSWFPHGYINEKTMKAVMNCWPKGTMSVEEVFRYIINPTKAKEATELLRTIVDKKANSWYKLMNFEYVTFSCQCTYHNKQGVITVTPYMVLDFDKKEILDAFPGMDIQVAVRKLKEMLIKDKNLFFVFAQHERILTGVSPQAALTVGRLQPKARVSIASWNLKEAVGKHLTRRTET